MLFLNSKVFSAEGDEKTIRDIIYQCDLEGIANNPDPEGSYVCVRESDYSRFRDIAEQIHRGNICSKIENSRKNKEG